MFILDKIDFKTKVIKRETEGHFIILKRRICQGDINIIKIYAPNIGAPKYIRKILENFKKDVESNTLILGNFNTPLSKKDRCRLGSRADGVTVGGSGAHLPLHTGGTPSQSSEERSEQPTLSQHM